MAQNYLQLKMQSNKQLAIALTNSLRDMHEEHMATLEKVKQGTQRLVSYGACLMPDEYYRNQSLINIIYGEGFPSPLLTSTQP
ncbi:TPA: hypothetical protein I4G56_26065 [Enterobacter asburiae]|uniref:hypothetical protein n=1 Tax=Enterobacter asburiae TaxID=61645 RepID=UPI0005EDF764|nr:hypothetical protein [Enterobacter asburiae]KJN59259.1 hypothetical protein SS43_02285 [Enterobacter asburiae]MCC2874156.1 hypothetical protein [Enterobacter asburiae]HAS1757683.1 hypothetical protein [Enterobacter asburiae]HAS1770417.1 hypothetical protein [Enterobacter asburiae]HAS1776034.1 hypothetical protein [Enterobacter asburiae]